MNLAKKQMFEIEGLISPVAMASLQTQFVVGNRQQFGFLLGELLISPDIYRCTDNFIPNTFYITSVMPVFDAASFQADLLKSSDKFLSDTFLKHAVRDNRRQPILGWYFQGNPNELLKGKDYSLHVKLLRQTLLLHQKMEGTLSNGVAFHAFFAAVVSYNKKRFSRDFSVGFQGFDEKNQLRMYDVKVNVVDHYFRPRYETDACLIDHSKILNYIREEIDSEHIRNVFNQLEDGVFVRPEPYCYQIHGNLLNRCFDLLCGALTKYCSRATGPRNIELESQLFDYKAFDVDPKAYHAVMTVIDYPERNLNLYDLLKLLTDLSCNPPSSEISVVKVGEGSPQLLQPEILVDMQEQISPSASKKETAGVSSAEKKTASVSFAEKKTVGVSSAEKKTASVSSAENKTIGVSSTGKKTTSVSSAKIESPSAEKVKTQAVLSSGSGEQNSKDSVNSQVGGVSMQAQSSKEALTESTLGKSVDRQVEESTPETVHEDTTSCEATRISKSKHKRKRKKHAASSVSKEGSISGNAETSPPEPNLEIQSIEKVSPFSNVPQDQLLVYSITSSKSSEMELPDLPVQRNSKVGDSMPAAKTNLPESDNSSTSSNTSESEEVSKPTEMEIKIVKRNTSARVSIPLSSIEEIPNPTKSIEKSGKIIDIGSGLQKSVENVEKSQAESKVTTISPDATDSRNATNSKNTSSSKCDRVEQTPVPAGQDAKHPNEKCEELKYETGVPVSRLTGGKEKSNERSTKSVSSQQSSKRVKAARKRSNPTVAETRVFSSTSAIIYREEASVAPPEALADSSQTVHSEKSESLSTQPQVSACESSKLPWPRSKNAYIIIPNIKKELSHADELWKYVLHPIPEHLLTALKSLRAWRNEASAEESTYSSSDPSAEVNPADSDEQLPDFQEAFGSLLNAESDKSDPEKLPPISEVVAELAEHSDSVLPHQVKKRKRPTLELLPRKSAFLSTTPLETLVEEDLSTSIEHESHELASNYDGVIPLCLLGDEFMIKAVSTEEKYAALSTMDSSDSDDSDLEATISECSSGEN